MKIAFVGLGNMGGGMAANLAQAGLAVHAFDLNPEALDHAKAAGCKIAASASEAAAGAEFVITMLPAGRHVEQVYAESVFPSATPGVVLVDCSTIEVSTARRLAEAAAARGLIAADAPVSGGTAAASAGTLTFMVGGSDEAFAAVKPILEKMGKAVIHTGGSGTGQATKICNNMLLGATMIATCEAFLLARNLGLDPQKFYDVASVSSGQSWSMTTYCPLPGVGPASPADNDYQGGFATALMLKDLRLAMEAAEGVSAFTPMGRKARDLYERYAASGESGRDFSGIIQALAKGDFERSAPIPSLSRPS